MANKFAGTTRLAGDSQTPRLEFAPHIIYGNAKVSKKTFNLYRREVLVDETPLYPEFKEELETLEGYFFGYTLGMHYRVSEDVSIESTHTVSMDHLNANGPIELAKTVDDGNSREFTKVGVFEYKELRKKLEGEERSNFSQSVNLWFYCPQYNNRIVVLRIQGSAVRGAYKLIETMPDGLVEITYGDEGTVVGSGKKKQTIFPVVANKLEDKVPSPDAALMAYNEELSKYANPTFTVSPVSPTRELREYTQYGALSHPTPAVSTPPSVSPAGLGALPVTPALGADDLEEAFGPEEME